MLANGMKTRAVFGWSIVPGLLSLVILGDDVGEAGTQREPYKIEIGMPEAPGFRRLLLALFVFTLGSSSDSFLLWHASEAGIPSYTHRCCGWY
jgi:hypothetical protein